MQRSNTLRTMIRRAVGASLALAAGFAVTAHAASFKCKPGQSFSEKTVCETPYLSKMDDQLAMAYQHALSVTPDPVALEASRTAQWQWRQKNCHDVACVTNWYERRLGELHADAAQGQKAQQVAFERGLDHQNLTPDAAAAVRQMKAPQAAQAAAPAEMPLKMSVNDLPKPAFAPHATHTAGKTASATAGPTKVISVNP